MKDFKDFKVAVMKDSRQIAEDIKNRVDLYAQQSNAADLDTYYKRAWAEFTTLELLERYHQWLFSDPAPIKQEDL